MQQSKNLVAHWPLAKNTNDVGPHQLGSTNHGVTFSKKNTNSSGLFDGLSNYVEVKTQRAFAARYESFLALHVGAHQRKPRRPAWRPS